MFQEFSGFSATPFTRGLATSKLFVAAGQEELKARLSYLVHERGIGLITGEIGSGKSTAIRAFVEGLDPTRATVVYTANPLIGITGLYREMLNQLGEPVPMLRQQMVLALRRCCDVLTNERKKTPILWSFDISCSRPTDERIGAGGAQNPRSEPSLAAPKAG